MISDDAIIVYPIKVGGSKWDNNELRHSLRSLDLFWKSKKPPKVFVITKEELPWLSDEVEVVPIHGYVDAMMKAIELADFHSEKGDFVWMNDDIFFLEPTSHEDLFPVRHQGWMKPFSTVPQQYQNGWRRKLVRVRDENARYGFPSYGFSTHLPYPYNAELLRQAMALYGFVYKTPIESAYFNMWSHLIPNVGDVSDRLLRHRENPIDADGKRFLNVADGGLTDKMKEFIQTKFPNPSKYEQD